MENCRFTFGKYLLEEGIVSLFCVKCNDVLIGPILVENLGNICTNCFNKHQAENDWNHQVNESLQKVFYQLKLPCNFKDAGCEEILDYELYSEHHKTCIFKIVKCPFDCHWEGPIKDVKTHCSADVHPHVTSNHYKQHDFVENNDLIEVVLYDGNKKYLFISRVLKEQLIFNLYKMDLSANHVENDEVYTLTLKSAEDQNCSYIVENLKVPFLFEHYKDPDNTRNWPVDLNSLKGTLKTDNMHFQIRVDINPQSMNDTLLRDIECPVCNIPMVAPIVSCSAGHNLCSSCKSRINSCPTCRADLYTVVRNIKLEEISARLIHTCSINCNFRDTGDKIQEHRDICQGQG